MRTLLDDAHTWFLHEVIYGERALAIALAEGKVGDEPEDLGIAGHVLRGTRRVEPTYGAPLMVVRFEAPVAWQLVDESFTCFDGGEVRDDSSLQVLSGSTSLAGRAP